MANNYTQTSFYFDCGTHENAKKVTAWITGNFEKGAGYPMELAKTMVDQVGLEVFEDGFLNVDIASAEMASEPEGSEVWVYMSEGGDFELLIEIMEYAMRNLPDVPSPQGFTYASTCSKMRVGEFDGGACAVFKDKPTRWINGSEWLKEQGVKA